MSKSFLGILPGKTLMFIGTPFLVDIGTYTDNVFQILCMLERSNE
jgi:hypothetical protein